MKADLPTSLPPLPPERELPDHRRLRQHVLARIDNAEQRSGVKVLAAGVSAAVAVAAIATLLAVVLPRIGPHTAPQAGPSGSVSSAPSAPVSSGPAVNVLTITEPVGSVVVSNPAGNVTVTGTNRMSVLVIEHFARAPGSRPEISHQLANGTLDVGYANPGCSSVTSHCPGVSFDVLVPQSTAVRVSSDAGDISLSGRLGDVHVVDLAGDVHVTGLASRLVTVRSGAGDVTATGLACQVVQVRSGAGNVSLALTTVPAQVLVIGQAGDIGLLLPPGNARYRVSARSPAGAVSIGVPSSPGSPHRITLTSDAGDIRIAG